MVMIVGSRAYRVAARSSPGFNAILRELLPTSLEQKGFALQVARIDERCEKMREKKRQSLPGLPWRGGCI